MGQGLRRVNVTGPSPRSSPVNLARYLSKYISKDFENAPREFEEHRYFCSLGVQVPTEKVELVLHRYAKNVEGKMFILVFQETLRRVGKHCSLTHWMGGAGRFGWIAGFEDLSVQWHT